jgi:hypothetical protein
MPGRAAIRNAEQRRGKVRLKDFREGGRRPHGFRKFIAVFGTTKYTNGRDKNSGNAGWRIAAGQLAAQPPPTTPSPPCPMEERAGPSSVAVLRRVEERRFV